jgi:hypothetical protein
MRRSARAALMIATVAAWLGSPSTWTEDAHHPAQAASADGQATTQRRAA